MHSSTLSMPCEATMIEADNITAMFIANRYIKIIQIKNDFYKRKISS